MNIFVQNTFSGFESTAKWFYINDNDILIVFSQATFRHFDASSQREMELNSTALFVVKAMGWTKQVCSVFNSSPIVSTPQQGAIVLVHKSVKNILPCFNG